MESIAELHPIVVHFPIAFFILYALLEIIGILSKKSNLSKFAHVTLLLGVVAALGAVLSGNQAFNVADNLSRQGIVIPHELIEEHENYATITLWYFVALLILRTFLTIKNKFKGIIKFSFIILALVGCFLIFETGEHGGELVYEHGVGTNLLKSIND